MLTTRPCLLVVVSVCIYEFEAVNGITTRSPVLRHGKEGQRNTYFSRWPAVRAREPNEERNY